MRLHEQGLPPEQVDELLVPGAGHPMGTLALVDLIGVDVTVTALESIPRSRTTRGSGLLRACGSCSPPAGRKTGAGLHQS